MANLYKACRDKNLINIIRILKNATKECLNFQSIELHQTALMKAIENETYDIARLLIIKGIDVNIKDIYDTTALYDILNKLRKFIFYVNLLRNDTYVRTKNENHDYNQIIETIDLLIVSGANIRDMTPNDKIIDLIRVLLHNKYIDTYSLIIMLLENGFDI